MSWRSVLLCLALASPVAQAEPAETTGTLTPDQSADVERAIANVAAHQAARAAAAQLVNSTPKVKIREILSGPDFRPEEVFNYPRFKKKPTEPESPPGWLKDLENFFKVLAQVLRAGVWVLGGVAVILLVITLHYWWRVYADRPQVGDAGLPSRVGGLDIRPESLPDDIGATARSLCLSGDVIGALSLLYRGALSALVTRHGAGIRASFTEQECLGAARQVVNSAGADYFQGLTRMWVHAVYARRQPADLEALTLCDQFNTHFALPVASDLHAEVAAEPAR